MSKNISKDQIIETALILINRTEGSRSVNLREIARELRCAHTNIYNYFDSMEDVIWHCVAAVLGQSESVIINKLGKKKFANADQVLKVFFESLIDFYLENRGWFKLIWLDVINGEKPAGVFEATAKTVNTFKNVVYNLFKDDITLKQAHIVLHNVHCYLQGEITAFISGRGFIADGQKFRSHVLNECIKLIKLLVFSIKNKNWENLI